jgi:fatty acid desaturase
LARICHTHRRWFGVVSAELGSLRAELRAAGAFETREPRSWAKLALLAVLLAGCLFGLAHTGWLGALLWIPAAAVCCTSIAMLGHEGSHRSFSVSPTRNALLVYLTFPLFSGLGALYWRDKHDRRHHAHPNVEGLDPDIKPFPFASSRGGHDACSAGERWFQRMFQRWLFWPMAILMGIGMRRSSLLFLARHPRKRERAWSIEVACLVGHYLGWVVIPSLVWGPVAAIGAYLAIWAVVGVFLALVFAPAHMGLPIVGAPNHEWQHQLATTRDLELPRPISFFFIGLDYQVEHHLFPRIPHQNLPAAARITRAWCQRHGLHHQTEPYLTALASAERFMRDAWSREAVVPQHFVGLRLDSGADPRHTRALVSGDPKGPAFLAPRDTTG